MPICSAESKRASPSQRLLSRADIQDEARNKYTTSSLNDQKNSNRQKLSKQHNKLGITGPCSTSTFLREKELFTELGSGLTMQRMTTYSCRKGLVNPSAVSFTVWRELNSFEVISCFMDQTFNNCIELGIVPLPLGSNWLWWILHKRRVYLETSIPYPLPFYSHSPFFMANPGVDSFKYF